uniref:FANCI helical domain-containing protein n=1 Tax=Panagrolaimus davidi TaxID=227884 RepID=A0A914QDG1_9BILA
MESSSKKASFNIINGKLEHIENDIAFVGRRILVNTIESVPIESDNKHSSEPLQALITAICSNATKIPNVYFFIDVLVELRKTRSSMLVMNWEIFDKLVRHICDVPSEVGVKVMSALMPVIIQRSGMRKAIFTSLRTEMVSVSKVSTALPVMFQLLRSLIEQPEAKAAFQCSQSFASFSSQLVGSQKKETGAVLDAIPIFECIKRCMHQSPATKCLVYKGIVDICKKNNYFVMHGLDLLLHELTSLPELKISAYMDKTSDGYNYVKYQCPQLLKATHAVLSAASFAYENVPQYAQTQLSQNGVDIISKAHSALENYINSVIGVHLEDLKMDKANEDLKNETTKTSYYGMFGIMLLQLYDVIIECLWKFNSDDTNDEALNKIEDLISRRKALSELVETKKKSEKDPNNKDESVEVPKLIVQDLQIDIPKLSAMLEDLDS